jgi:hypothetical protein
MKNSKRNLQTILMIVCLSFYYSIAYAQNNKIQYIVKDKNTSDTIKNAKLTLCNVDNEIVKIQEADATGLVAIELTGSGKYKFVISADGYESATISYSSQTKEGLYLKDVVKLKPILKKE